MLDCVGLLAAGNEELQRFAWKTFADWQTREEDNEHEKSEKKKKYEFMRKFRETFSIPVKRIRFLGLFDTVNSVPRFEAAWMSRSKFPYTVKSSAKVIRHAVSIDERRAKFRQDLVGQKKPFHEHTRNGTGLEKANGKHPTLHRMGTGLSSRFQPRHRRPSQIALQPIPSTNASTSSLHSVNSATVAQERTLDVGLNDEEDEHAAQDIQEVWFPGAHADIGGGWALMEGEEVSISHAPLVWMIREAKKAGLPFDEDALASANYLYKDEPSDAPTSPFRRDSIIPTIEVDGVAQSLSVETPAETANRTAFREKFDKAVQKGRIHDVLSFNNGAAAGATIAWNFMEYLPFRRMDLQENGVWKPIRWPLPCGETRDIPADAWIHGSVLRRMEADPNYRPGNLIIGGGGRGLKKAPEEVGVGKWRVLQEEGSMVGEILVRATPAGDIEALKH